MKNRPYSLLRLKRRARRGDRSKGEHREFADERRRRSTAAAQRVHRSGRGEWRRPRASPSPSEVAVSGETMRSGTGQDSRFVKEIYIPEENCPDYVIFQNDPQTFQTTVVLPTYKFNQYHVKVHRNFMFSFIHQRLSKIQKILKMNN